MAITSIDKLMGRTFFVPGYQRGYRWGRQEVEALLNDLWEFYLQTDGEKNTFYCLQPIVLYKDEQARENLLDGQQRLTTIYLLLSYLDSRRREEGYDKPLFTLEYATREDSADFLAKKLFASEESEVASNVDYHYMRAAYGYIKYWFTQAPKHPGAAGKLIPLLLDEDGKGPNVRVIEYYVEDDSDPIDVFLRLNQGKIPLTDAELTKALFLQSDKYDAKLLPYVSPKLDLIAVNGMLMSSSCLCRNSGTSSLRMMRSLHLPQFDFYWSLLPETFSQRQATRTPLSYGSRRSTRTLATRSSLIICRGTVVKSA